MKILFFGDIVGKIGRRAITQVLPKLKKKLKADFVIANGENLAHGKGLSQETVEEVIAAGIDLLTTGNHISNKPAYVELLAAEDFKVIRPANYPPSVPGQGFKILSTDKLRLAVINLMGRVFFRETLDDPFRKLDEILGLINQSKASGLVPVIIDWHTEASSEKAALGWYADGRVAAVIGTHTHVPTADSRILPQGTAFISDVGMVGARDSMLGMLPEGPLTMFRTQLPQKFEPPESGLAQVNAVLLEIEIATGLARKIERLDNELMINS